MTENEKIDAVFRFIASYKDGVTDNLLAGLYLSKIDYDKILLEFIDDGTVIQRADKYMLTSYGRTINRAGGWTKYHNDILADKKLQRDNLEAAIKTNKSVLKNQSRQNVILWITCISGLISAFATLGQCNTAAQQDRQNKCRLKQQRSCPACHSGRNHSQLFLPKTHKQTLTTSP